MLMLADHAERVNRAMIMKDDAPVDLHRGELRFFAHVQDACEKAPQILQQLNQAEEHGNATP